jgi:sporulation related protein
MSDSIFNRPRRQIEPRQPDEHGRDFTDQSYTPDHGAAVRRDPGTDAMSELARLISDPHAIPGRPSDAPGGRLTDVLRGASSSTAAARAPSTRPPAREPAQSQSDEDRSSEDWSRRSSLDRGVRRDPDFSRPRAAVQPTEADTGHSEPPRDSFDFLQLPDRDDYAVAPRQALAEGDDYDLGDRRESSLAPRRPPAYGRQDEECADEYSENEYGQDADHEYEGEHEEPDGAESGTKRRSTTKVAIAVLGLAVFGSAAAFGYRTIFKAAPSGPAPIIRADNSPTKVTPVGAGVNAKPANGPFADRSGEQLVRRDEEPVDVASTYRAVEPRTAGFPPPEIVPATAGPAPSADPKRVRTVPIRVDQSAPSDRTASRAAPPPQSQPPLSAPTSQPPMPAPARQVAVSPPPQSQPPLPAPTRQAAVSPPPSYSPPPAAESRMGGGVATAPEAAASRAVEAGGFVVQLSAQRSEAEAQAAFRTLQTKYAVLSGRDPLIRRKDLGEKGIFFAAQVGPFGVKSDADQLCETLKAAGGACFVQRN